MIRIYALVSRGTIMSLCVVLILAMVQSAPAQTSQATEAFDEIQQHIIALRDEFKQWIQRAENDHDIIREHIARKLQELLAQKADSTAAYPEMMENVAQLQSAINSYTTDLENLEQTVGNIETILNEHLDQIEMKLAELKVYGVPRQRTATEPGGLPVPEETASGPVESPEGPVPQIPPGQLFRAAYSFYIEGDYDTAIAGFQKYLIDYPDTPLAGAAQYWIAESLAKLEEYEIALREYDRLITQYPQNDKLPDAYYGKASVFLKIGQTEEAKNLFQYVIDHHPGSIAAKKAENRLQELL